MKRIAYLCGSESWGGLEMNQYRNALWMKERGRDVIVLGRADSRMETACVESGIHFFPVGKHKKYYDYSAARKLASILKEQKVQHLIIRDVRDMSVSAIAKSNVPGLKLHYFMEMQLGVKKTGLLHTIRFRKLDTWSCPLVWLKEQVETMTNMPKERIVHIPSGLDIEALQTGFTKEQARKEMDLPPEKILIGLAGRFDPQKGQLLLLKAAKLVKDQNFGIVLLGEPTFNEGDSYEKEVLDFIASSGLKDRVFIRPFRKDIETFYHAIDAFVMASKAETFGMVTIEAMACGTPVIGSNAGGTVELLKSGKIGYLFQPLSETDLASKIDEFLSNPAKFNSELLKKEMEMFGKDEVCDAVERLLASSENQNN